jgi:hypothetical protein
MTMHGMFWRFPGSFSKGNTAGIRPRSAYLKVIGDFTRWNDRLVFGCDDSAKNEFLNKRKVKGNIGGAGQSNSNLWFTSPSLPDQLGPATAEGAVWLNEQVAENVPSEPFLFAGWPKRCVWIRNHGNATVNFRFEVDKEGNGNWELQQKIKVEAGETEFIDFRADESGEWICVIPDRSTTATVQFSYTGEDNRPYSPAKTFQGLAGVNENKALGGLIFGLGHNRRTLGMSAFNFDDGKEINTGYYELDADMKLMHKEDKSTQSYINEKFAIPKQVVSVESSSVLIVDDKGRRWRLPLGNSAYNDLISAGRLRICREVATERDLFSCQGAFYELPAENADGFAKIRPIASHNFRIHDYASFRGMLIMTGINLSETKDNPHIIVSDDGKAALWAGVIDDLWNLGKPTGHGGPWKNTVIEAGVPSDPYLIGFYDKRELEITHDLNEPVIFTVEADPVGNGDWMTYKKVNVLPGETFKYVFPENFQARWIRFVSGKDCKAITLLKYE